mgnify:CR=1 FL=1
MEFVYQSARLTWVPGQGYRHPHSGQWVAEPNQALRGWIAPAEERPAWVALVAAITEYWRHNPPPIGDGGEVVEFG